MLCRTAICGFCLLVAFTSLGQPAHAQSSSYTSLSDIYFDYDLYYGLPETVYNLYIVYDDGREELYVRYTSYSKLSDQLRDFNRGFLPSTRVVDWYYEKDREVARWYRYSNYETLAEAESNADWIIAMGYETDIRWLYNPTFVRP